MKHFGHIALFASSLFISFCSQKPKETQDLGRWKYYAGCSENQCRAWNSACQAECMNADSKVDGQLCIDQCRNHYEACLPGCQPK